MSGELEAGGDEATSDSNHDLCLNKMSEETKPWKTRSYPGCIQWNRMSRYFERTSFTV